MSKQRLVMRNVGPIVEADVTFADLTVIVGPQATGKSIFLQTLKLVQDRNRIHEVFAHHSVVFNGDPAGFLGGYYGKGMVSAWKADSSLQWQGKSLSLLDFGKPARGGKRTESVFFIPAQRVMSLSGGVTQNFGQFNYGDPFALRYFSDVVHDLVQNEFGAKGELFPQPNRLNADLRRPINEHLFGGSRLAIDANDFTKRLVLKVPGHTEGLPYTAWSAGQREFTPLLMGLYWLCTSGATSRRERLEWVVIEEPEMGLHPQGIATVLLLVLELLRRGYKVVLSTHSTVVLDMVWALREFKALTGTERDVRELFGLKNTPVTRELGAAALEKDYRVYFFGRDGRSVDISGLDPASTSAAEAQWGGLVGFASHTGEVIAKVVNRFEAQQAEPSRTTRKSSEASS